MMKNNYKTLFTFFSFFFVCISANAQFLLTDEFDFWEDQSTHDYITDGATTSGAYNCSGDLTLRVGDCSSGTISSVSITLDVTPNCDSIQLDFLIPWGYAPAISIDGVNQATFIFSASCNYVSYVIPNATSYTADGIISLLLEDTIPSSCSGDFQIARMKAYSSSTHVTGTSFNQRGVSNNLTLFPNPFDGALNINYTSQGESVKEVVIVNTNGELVYTENVNSLSNNYTKHIDLSNMANGMYFVKVTTDVRVIAKKITLLAN